MGSTNYGISTQGRYANSTIPRGLYILINILQTYSRSPIHKILDGWIHIKPYKNINRQKIMGVKISKRKNNGQTHYITSKSGKQPT